MTEVGFDALQPLPPQPAFRDASGAWVLSQYEDVLAAFRHPRLLPVDAKGQTGADPRDGRGVMVQRPEVIDALAPHIAEWDATARERALALLGGLRGGTADLLADFALPWCLSLGMMVLGAPGPDADHLATLGAAIFARGGSPADSELRPRAAAATVEMEHYFATSRFPMPQPSFMGISQTLPRLLATGWLALLRTPAEMQRLRSDPGLMPNAVEELMRYAGIIFNLYRKATDEVQIGSRTIGAGEQTVLRISSANRDPAKFSEPNRLDLSRRVTGQLALGLGRSSCAGARIVRMAYACSTRALLDTFRGINLSGDPEWHTGSGFCYPRLLRVTLARS